MANSAQARKRIRQDVGRRLRNKSTKSELATLEKKLNAALESKDKDAATAIMPELVAKIDRAAHRNVMHKNNAANRKARLTKLVNGLS